MAVSFSISYLCTTQGCPHLPIYLASSCSRHLILSPTKWHLHNSRTTYPRSILHPPSTQFRQWHPSSHTVMDHSLTCPNYLEILWSSLTHQHPFYSRSSIYPLILNYLTLYRHSWHPWQTSETLQLQLSLISWVRDIVITTGTPALSRGYHLNLELMNDKYFNYNC